MHDQWIVNVEYKFIFYAYLYLSFSVYHYTLCVQYIEYVWVKTALCNNALKTLYTSKYLKILTALGDVYLGY